MAKPPQRTPPPKQHVVHQSDSDSDSDKVAKSKIPVNNKKVPSESDFGGQLQGSVIPPKDKKKIISKDSDDSWDEPAHIPESSKGSKSKSRGKPVGDEEDLADEVARWEIDPSEVVLGKN